ncbi:LacI family DNA-binding transcriptional regulator [Bifidobacterium sp. ESL0769]|uniref:LacI family DNA-binding transcriptional regulator n=1 Tax=Bifidobacterium sp. ESL0769 TaxID=2983229 RepID=UPI0023F6F954|nr:LacI family DNA-binding transcriptional regulator [Bifidobacterium sp. ESL0769]WEV67040.1 LacI family DNA-binding transcriptional regulator [Bifidobacterium sp. ESL0769]
MAKVSPKTVSRVINGERYVSKELHEKVIEAINELNYLPDSHAANLRRNNKRSNTIGVLVGSKANPFSSTIHWAIDTIATQHSNLVLASALTGDSEQDHNIITTMLSHRIDALALVTPITNQSFLLPEVKRGLVVAFIDSPPLGISADSIMADNFQGAFLATSHLMEHGHTRIAYLGADPQVFTVHERQRGFLEATKQLGSKGKAIVINNLDEKTVFPAVKQILAGSNPPTAIFAAQNLIARETIRALHNLKKEHDVALVGFDDNELFDIVDPAITVVAQDANQLGTVAAQQIFNRLEGDTSEAHHIVLPTKLIERGSGEIAPINNSKKK